MDGAYLAREFIAWHLRALNPGLTFNEWEASLSVCGFARRARLPLDELIEWLYVVGPGLCLWDVRDRCLALENAGERIAAEAAGRTDVVGECVETLVSGSLADTNGISSVLSGGGDHAGAQGMGSVGFGSDADAA